MRVLVAVDMEGIAGVVDGDDISPGHAEYERNRVLLTAEASAAVRGSQACPRCPRGRTLRYAAPDFPTAYQISELIALLGAL